MFGLNKQQFILFLALGSIIVALAFFAVNDGKTMIKSEKGEESFNVIQLEQPTITPDLDSNVELNQRTEEDSVKKVEEIEVTIYVTGCVSEPGVYTLKEGSRLSDALKIAGGPTDEANLLGVNLAVIVKDEGMYVVPKIGEEINNRPQLTTMDLSQQNSSTKININTASQTELEQLSGIGPVKAEAIISHREAHGLFRATNELTSVTGIGDKTFDAIKDDICVN